MSCIFLFFIFFSIGGINLTLKSQVKKLINFYQSQAGSYKELLDLAKQERKIIKSEQYEKLDDILAKKSDIIDDINKLEQEIDLVNENLASKLDISNEDEFILKLLQIDNLPYSNKLKRIVKNNFKLLQETIEIESASQATMSNEKNRLSKKLGLLEQGLTLNKKYHKKTDNYEGNFIDQKK
jgi:hypothetical protein